MSGRRDAPAEPVEEAVHGTREAFRRGILSEQQARGAALSAEFSGTVAGLRQCMYCQAMPQVEKSLPMRVVAPSFQFSLSDWRCATGTESVRP